MLSFTSQYADDDEYNDEPGTGPPAHRFLRRRRCRFNQRITCGLHLGAILELKAARRDSVAAQETFQIVQFLAGTGGLAEPAAEFL
jgi:hypothetical protein